MKKVLMLSIVFLFFVGIINAQFLRDDDSYSIKFDWANSAWNPNGVVVIFDSGEVLMTAVRTSRGFNVYAKNNSQDAEKMAIRAKERVQSEYTVKEMTKKYEDTYKGLLK